MNSRQNEVMKAGLRDEKDVLNALEKNYTSALADIKKNIKELQSNPLTQSKAYQIDFQKQLKKQISGIVDNLQGKNFSSISDYLNTCYHQGFIGTMYDLQGQGLPLVLPINQNKILKAVQKTGDDIKLSKKIGVNTDALKQDVISELQRGLSTEMPYAEMARNISNRGSANLSRSNLIARTEGHRVQNEAKIDSLTAAKDAGADIVKQWDATLDGATRETHQKLNGQIVELDEDFEVDGMTAPYPGGFGDPAEDCNCRCCLLQRVREEAANDDNHQKWNNESGGFIECSGYEDFKERYLQILNENDIIKTEASNGISVTSISVHTLKRAAERGICSGAVVDSLQHPLHVNDVVTDELGRNSQRFIGNTATVNVNPDSGKVTTVWRTGKATRKKYAKKGD